MNQAAQPVTLDQLARLYADRNRANSDLSKAMCAKPRDLDLIERLRQRSRALNSAYDADRKKFKRQQKAANKSQMLTTMIKFYMDYQDATTP